MRLSRLSGSCGSEFWVCVAAVEGLRAGREANATEGTVGPGGEDETEEGTSEITTLGVGIEPNCISASSVDEEGTKYG
jgi:hypothetical protein